MSQSLPTLVFNRLVLVRDLATRGANLLAGNPNSFAATQGLVLLDLGIEICLNTTVAELGLARTSDNFNDLLAAVSVLRPQQQDVGALHKLRNAAQHKGVSPQQADCAWARTVALTALRTLFPLVGADFDKLSSVPQLASAYFRKPLARALQLAGPSPADASALAARAMARVRGWISQVAGEALVPDEMWVFTNERWNDNTIRAACADGRDDFLDAMLTLAAGATMGIQPPDLLRFSRITSGHVATADDAAPDGFQTQHEKQADTPTEDNVRWAVELVARCALRFEQEWPDLVLTRDESRD
jgi:hypothetical protein